LYVIRNNNPNILDVNMNIVWWWCWSPEASLDSGCAPATPADAQSDRWKSLQFCHYSWIM